MTAELQTLHALAEHCLTCANWSIKTSPMAPAAMAPCALKNKWDYLPPRGACGAYRALPDDLSEKRILWIGRRYVKPKKGESA